MMLDLDFEVIARTWPYLLGGLRYTVQLTAVAAIGGLLLGAVLALARLSSFKPLALLVAGYVNLMRSVPLILVIFWVYFLLPGMLQILLGTERPVQVGPDRSAYITFIMFEAAYFCEIVRAAIQSVSRTQVSAAYALGLNYRRTMQLVILPQALRNMLPVLMTQVIVLFQDVSLVSLLNVTDFVGASVKIAQRDGAVVELYLFVAIVYFLLCFALSSAVRHLQGRMAIVR
jgi:glutamate/aspartate transport system permease protein